MAEKDPDHIGNGSQQTIGELIGHVKNLKQAEDNARKSRALLFRRVEGVERSVVDMDHKMSTGMAALQQQIAGVQATLSPIAEAYRTVNVRVEGGKWWVNALKGFGVFIGKALSLVTAAGLVIWAVLQAMAPKLAAIISAMAGMPI